MPYSIINFDNFPQIVQVVVLKYFTRSHKKNSDAAASISGTVCAYNVKHPVGMTATNKKAVNKRGTQYHTCLFFCEIKVSKHRWARVESSGGGGKEGGP